MVTRLFPATFAVDDMDLVVVVVVAVVVVIVVAATVAVAGLRACLKASKDSC